MANIFPRWTNLLPLKIAVCLGALGTAVVAGFAYYATPKAQRVGYQPSQPIPYDHDLHVTQLGLDCRYCHSFVEHSGHANVPTANVCWNCHQHVAKGSPKLAALRDAVGVNVDHLALEGEAGKGHPIEWVRVHRTPDYVYFNHSAHVNRGVSCLECHGRVDQMQTVYHAKSHSMAFCIDCHRAPEHRLRPLEEVYNLAYNAEDYLKEHDIRDADGNRIENQLDFGMHLKQHWNINPKESCSTCHR